MWRPLRSVEGFRVCAGRYAERASHARDCLDRATGIDIGRTRPFPPVPGVDDAAEIAGDAERRRYTRDRLLVAAGGDGRRCPFRPVPKGALAELVDHGTKADRRAGDRGIRRHGLRIGQRRRSPMRAVPRAPVAVCIHRHAEFRGSTGDRRETVRVRVDVHRPCPGTPLEQQRVPSVVDGRTEAWAGARHPGDGGVGRRMGVDRQGVAPDRRGDDRARNRSARGESGRRSRARRRRSGQHRHDQHRCRSTESTKDHAGSAAPAEPESWQGQPLAAHRIPPAPTIAPRQSRQTHKLPMRCPTRLDTCSTASNVATPSTQATPTVRRQ